MPRRCSPTVNQTSINHDPNVHRPLCVTIQHPLTPIAPLCRYPLPQPCAHSSRRAQAERAVSRFEEAGGVLGDLGMALIRLAKFEGEQGVASSTYSASAADCRSLAADCQRTGKAGPRFSHLIAL